jgi:hypothetical protein
VLSGRYSGNYSFKEYCDENKIKINRDNSTQKYDDIKALRDVIVDPSESSLSECNNRTDRIRE